MSFFQLDPASLAERARNQAVPSLGASIARGAISFTLLSVAGFVPWAVFGRTLYRAIGEAGMYAVCAVVFIALSGPLLHRLIIGTGSLSRFYKLFTLAFIPYSVAWTVGWMALRGHPGSIAGLLAGAVVMGPILAAAFDARGSTLKVIVVLFLANAAGYFIGGVCEANVPGVTGKLLWGVCYGLGFGAGLGWAFHECQTPARRLLVTGRR